MTDTPAPAPLPRFRDAAPFWLALALIPVAVLGALVGGWTVALMPLVSWVTFGLLDTVLGTEERNADPQTPDGDLIWYRLVTLVWFPVQAALLLWLLWYVPQAAHLGWVEKVALFFGMGIVAGTIGIVFAHELMHKGNRGERWLGDLLLASVLYSHFRSEHLRVHHSWVGTPRDPVTARLGEGFPAYFVRVLRQCPPSAWKAERQLLAKAGRPVWHLSNPFWRYGALQGSFVVLALWLGGWQGLGLFLLQAFTAIWQLELVNYVEHYGLTRRHLGDGRYERMMPHHSWNAAHRASNWLLINLQRHSDHHTKPDRRFPLLQTYGDEVAPNLPFGYPLMTTAAMVPPLWRRIMNRRVRAWRRQWYPDIADWSAYDRGTNPMPASAG